MLDWILLALLGIILGGAILSWVCACLNMDAAGMLFLIISGGAMVAFGLLGAGVTVMGLLQDPPFLPGMLMLTTQLWLASILGTSVCLGFAILGTWTIRMSAEALGLLAD